MANSILGKSKQPAPNMMHQFQQFRNNFQGNPQQMVQHMLQTGKITEPQLQQAMQMARQFQQFIK